MYHLPTICFILFFFSFLYVILENLQSTQSMYCFCQSNLICTTRHTCSDFLKNLVNPKMIYHDLVQFSGSTQESNTVWCQVGLALGSIAFATNTSTQILQPLIGVMLGWDRLARQKNLTFVLICYKLVLDLNIFSYSEDLQNPIWHLAIWQNWDFESILASQS